MFRARPARRQAANQQPKVIVAMGTDIHGVVEEKTASGTWVAVRVLADFCDERGTWHGCAARSRNYERFAALAGVRGEGPIPRGIPVDASETTRYLFEGRGCHSASWLPLDEATAIFARTDPYISEKNREDLLRQERDTAFDYYYFCEIGEGDDFRLVFWFDN